MPKRASSKGRKRGHSGPQSASDGVSGSDTTAKSSKAQKQRKSNAEYVKPYQWKKGQSGNPGGRPKGSNLTARLRRALAENDGKLAELIVRRLIVEAGKGKFQHVKEIFDRVDGSVVQRFQMEDALQEMLRTAERVLERDQYAKLVFALAGDGSQGSGQAEAEQEPLH